MKNPSDNIYWFHFEIKGYSGDADTDGYLKITVTRPLVDNTTVFEQTLNFAYIYSIFGSVSHGRSGGKYETHWALDDLSVKLPRPDDIPAEPSISVSGDADDDLKIVTVALAEGAASSVTLWYKKSSDAEYTPSASSSIQLEMLNSDVIYAYAENNGNLSDVVSEYVVAGSIPTPTGSITGVDGASRTVTFVSDYDIQYKTSENDEFVDSATKIFTVDASTTYYVRAKKVSSVVNTVTFYSDVLTLAVEAGTSVKLAAPSAYYRSGVNFVTVYAPQTSVVASPTPTIKYKVTSKTGTFEKATSNGYATLDCGDEDGAVVTCWATCDGYEDSDTYQVTLSNLNAHNYACIYTLDYAALFTANTSWSPAYGSLLYVDSGETIQRCYLSVNGDSSIISDPIFYNYEKNNAGNVTQRHQNGTWNDIHALYTYTTQKTPVITKLKDGDIINVIATDASASTGLANSAVATSSGYDKYFDVTAQDVDEDGYGYAIFSTALRQNIFAIRIYRPAAASLDGVGYVTFAEALTAAGNAGSGTITLNANVTGNVVIPAAGISIICGDYSINGNVTGARFVGVSYNSTTKTYTSSTNTAATWVGGATGRWLDPLNWSTKSIPTWDTDVTIDTDCTIYITGTVWEDDFSTRDMCRGMTIDANVALQSGATPGWCFLALYGNVTGSGKLTLTWVGIDGLSSPTTTFGCDIKINSAYDDYYSCYRDSCFLNYDRNISYAITGDIEVGENAIFNAFYNTDISGTLTLDNGASVYAGENVTLTLGNIVVADGATAKVSKHATGASYTVSGTVSAATSAYNAKGTTSGDVTTYTTTLRPVVEPGEAATATYDSEEAATAAVADVVVAVPAEVAAELSDEQETAYKAMFEAKAVESTTESGKYVVTVDFTAAAEAEIKAAEDAISVVDGATPQVTVTAKPGLYYFVKAGAAADSLAVDGTGTLATGTTIELTMPLPDSGVKYYKVVASPTSSL